MIPSLSKTKQYSSIYRKTDAACDRILLHMTTPISWETQHITPDQSRRDRAAVSIKAVSDYMSGTELAIKQNRSKLERMDSLRQNTLPVVNAALIKKCAIRSDGFTLVELLITVAIIAILAGLLIPVVKSTIETANASKCLSNLRQLGVILRLYSTEHNGLLPPVYDPSPVALTWLGTLSKDRYCPALSLSTYPMYHCPSWVNEGVIDRSSFTYGLTLDSEHVPAAFIQNLYLMSSTTILLADSIVDTGSPSAGSGLESYYINRKVNSSKLIHLRHNNKANAVFVDGHAGAVTSQEIIDSGIIKTSKYKK